MRKSWLLLLLLMGLFFYTSGVCAQEDEYSENSEDPTEENLTEEQEHTVDTLLETMNASRRKISGSGESSLLDVGESILNASSVSSPTKGLAGAPSGVLKIAVYDNQRYPVAQASVEVSGPSGGSSEKRTYSTTQMGQCYFSAIASGTYEITVSNPKNKNIPSQTKTIEIKSNAENMLLFELGS